MGVDAVPRLVAVSRSLSPCYVMMDHAVDLIWTLDNTLEAYFLVLLGFLTSEHDVGIHRAPHG